MDHGVAPTIVFHLFPPYRTSVSTEDSVDGVVRRPQSSFFCNASACAVRLNVDKIHFEKDKRRASTSTSYLTKTNRVKLFFISARCTCTCNEMFFWKHMIVYTFFEGRA